MDTLLYPNGIANEDTDFKIIEKLGLALHKLLEDLNDNFVIEGCAITGSSGSANVSAGLVYINKKIRTFAGAIGIDLSTTKYFQADTETATGVRPVAADVGGGTANSYTTKNCSIQTSSLGSNEVAISFASAPKRLFEGVLYKKSSIDTLINAINSDLSAVFIAATLNSTDWEGVSGVDGLAYKKVGNLIYLRGLVKPKTNGVTSECATLPVGYRPTNERYCQITYGDQTQNAYVTFQTDGKLVLTAFENDGSGSAALQSAYGFSFDSIFFQL